MYKRGLGYRNQHNDEKYRTGSLVLYPSKELKQLLVTLSGALLDLLRSILLLLRDQLAQFIRPVLQLRAEGLVAGNAVHLQSQLDSVVDGNVLLEHVLDAVPVSDLGVERAERPRRQQSSCVRGNLVALITTFELIQSTSSTQLEKHTDHGWPSSRVLRDVVFNVLRSLHQLDCLLSQAQCLGSGRSLEIRRLSLLVQSVEVLARNASIVQAQTRLLGLFRTFQHDSQSVRLSGFAHQPFPAVIIEITLRRPQSNQEGDDVLPVLGRLHQLHNVRDLNLARSRHVVHRAEEELLIVTDRNRDGFLFESTGVFLSEDQLSLLDTQGEGYEELFAKPVQGLVEFGRGCLRKGRDSFQIIATLAMTHIEG